VETFLKKLENPNSEKKSATAVIPRTGNFPNRSHRAQAKKINVSGDLDKGWIRGEMSAINEDVLIGAGDLTIGFALKDTTVKSEKQRQRWKKKGRRKSTKKMFISKEVFGFSKRKEGEWGDINEGQITQKKSHPEGKKQNQQQQDIIGTKGFISGKRK